MTEHDKKVWTEIAAGGFLVALLFWLLYNSFHTPVQSVSQSQPSPVVEPAVNNNGNTTFAPVSLSPVQVPQITFGASKSGCSGCNSCSSGSGCSVGSSSDPGIAQIVSMSNNALATMQAASDATIRSIAAIGTTASGGRQTFITGPGY